MIPLHRAAAEGGQTPPTLPAAARHASLRRVVGLPALVLYAVGISVGAGIFVLVGRIAGLSGSLAPGASDTFTVRLDNATVGTKSGDVSFSTNDGDENPFHFRITGIVTAVAANLALGRPAVASTSYSGLPASNATDGNPASRWSSQFSDSEWIYVDLGSVHTIQRRTRGSSTTAQKFLARQPTSMALPRA